MVSVLPPGIAVRKRQRSHSEISRVEPLSGLPSRLFSVYLSGLPIRFSVFTQTLSDLTLYRSKVRSDTLWLTSGRASGRKTRAKTKF